MFRSLSHLLFPFIVHVLKGDPNEESGLKTIFNHFRNTHARYGMKPGQVPRDNYDRRRLRKQPRAHTQTDTANSWVRRCCGFAHETAPNLREIVSKTLGKLVGVTDTLSNFRAYRREIVSDFNLRGGETFGAEFLIIAKKKGLAIGEIMYDPPPRRRNPRIGGTIKANLRILWALLKSFTLYLI